MAGVRTRRWTAAAVTALGAGLPAACGSPAAGGRPATAATAPAGASSAATGPSAAPSAGAGSASQGGTPSASAAPVGGSCAGQWAGAAVQVLGHDTRQDMVELVVRTGYWSCGSPNPDAPVWQATGPQQEIRLSETAAIEADTPFVDGNQNRPIGVSAFVAKLGALPPGTGPLVFRYRTDTSGTITGLDQFRRS